MATKGWTEMDPLGTLLVSLGTLIVLDLDIVRELAASEIEVVTAIATMLAARVRYDLRLIAVRSLGNITACESLGKVGINQRNSKVADIAPANCATMKPAESTGRMPTKVSLIERASVTAGSANEVDAVNQ